MIAINDTTPNIFFNKLILPSHGFEFPIRINQNNLKLSTVWPLLVVLLAYEKISK